MTMPPLHGSAQRRLLQAGLLAACVIALIATTLVMLRVAAERLLERDAGHTALAWADYRKLAPRADGSADAVITKE